jgi:hypothetical protein
MVGRPLGLRLGDAALAHDAYTDIRNQVIRAPERWHDVSVSVELSLGVGTRRRPWAHVRRDLALGVPRGADQFDDALRRRVTALDFIASSEPTRIE